MMRCEKCGVEIDRLDVDIFNRDGSDQFSPMPFKCVPENAVVIDLTPNWTGEELTEDEMRETIRCPHCGKFPFQNEEIQTYQIVRVVCFRRGTGRGSSLLFANLEEVIDSAD